MYCEEMRDKGSAPFITNAGMCRDREVHLILRNAGEREGKCTLYHVMWVYAGVVYLILRNGGICRGREVQLILRNAGGNVGIGSVP